MLLNLNVFYGCAMSHVGVGAIRYQLGNGYNSRNIFYLCTDLVFIIATFEKVTSLIQTFF